MLLTLVIILILIGSAVVGSLYSNFSVFYENFTESENYHKARYAAIAATERAELVIKQREPGFEGSGGRILGVKLSTGASPSDGITSGFSYLSNIDTEDNKSTIFRKINSRATRIPALGGGNVEKLLSADDSPDYNMMDYENSEIFLLYYDNLDGKPYDKKSCPSYCEQSKLPKGIKVSIRLPEYVREKFRDLNPYKSLIITGAYTDDAIVDWQLRGNYYENTPFTIFATQNAAGKYPYGAQPNDSTIRESDLNSTTGAYLQFIDKNRNPKKNNLDDTGPTIISSKDADITGYAGNKRFLRIFEGDGYFSELQLKFSLLNLVLGSGETAKRYPFLEYYVDFSGTVSDKYFTIQTEGNFGDYKIDNIIFKPTITESILKSFTTIL